MGFLCRCPPRSCSTETPLRWVQPSSRSPCRQHPSSLSSWDPRPHPQSPAISTPPSCRLVPLELATFHEAPQLPGSDSPAALTHALSHCRPPSDGVILATGGNQSWERRGSRQEIRVTGLCLAVPHGAPPFPPYMRPSLLCVTALITSMEGCRWSLLKKKTSLPFPPAPRPRRAAPLYRSEVFTDCVHILPSRPLSAQLPAPSRLSNQWSKMSLHLT